MKGKACKKCPVLVGRSGKKAKKLLKLARDAKAV